MGIDPLPVTDALWMVSVWAPGNVSGKDPLGAMALLFGAESFCSAGGAALSLEGLDAKELPEGVKLVADPVSDGRVLSVSVGRMPGR